MKRDKWCVYLSCAALLTTLAGCGKKGALLYPDMLVPAAVSGQTAIQSGATVHLSFGVPDKDLAGRSLRELAGIKVFKRSEAVAVMQPCMECRDDYRLFRTLYLDLPDSFHRYGDRIVIVDNDLSVAGAASYYAIPFLRDGSEGQGSTPVRVAHASPPATPSLIAAAEPSEIRLAITSVPPTVGILVGYNLYRAADDEQLPLVPLNAEPLIATTYVDSGLERKRVYRYAVTSVVRLPSGVLVESALSPEVRSSLKEDD